MKLSRQMYYLMDEYLGDFLDYVPPDLNHLEVYSHRLVTIILEIGPEVLSSFDIALNIIKDRSRWFSKVVAEDSEDLWKKEDALKKRKRSLTFLDYYRFLDKHSMPKLSSATVVFEDLDAYMMPFEKSNPEWWENYNLLRHDKYTNLKTATLRTTLNACGALFWLVYQNQSLAGFESDLFKISDWGDLTSSLKKL